MGKLPREDYAMIGVIRESSLNLITLKMTGPAQEVGKQREAFYEYMRGFEAIYDHKIDSSIEEVKIETGGGGE
jgi:hypothetical protein